ncbi:MAG: IS110 family transposase [Candidatus Binatia bacterium]
MSEKITPVYAGLDVAKRTLQLHLQNRQHPLPNDPTGQAQLVGLLQAVPGVHVICEATGGYERAPVAALHTAALPVSVLNPSQTHAFARATGQRAKNDPIDAAGLTAYGVALRPPATPAPAALDAELAALVRWRNQLVDLRTAAQNQAEHHVLPFVTTQHAELLAQLASQLKAVDQELGALAARHAALQQKVQRLTEIAGVGQVTALAVLAQMPELGTLSRGAAAALAGLAPWDRQSGPWEGQRHIGGGRAGVRRALYMPAVAALRCHATLKAFYRRLRDAGKPAKVALTAVMRKLIVLMNHALKDPSFSLAA